MVYTKAAKTGTSSLKIFEYYLVWDVLVLLVLLFRMVSESIGK